MKLTYFFIFFLSLIQHPLHLSAQICGASESYNTQEKVIFKTFLSKKVSESSGLIYSEGKLWTHDDSGGPAAIFNIDTLTGEVKQTIFIDNYPNIDWEDITADSNYIYIGDFGNNNGVRKDLKVLKLSKSLINSSSRVHLNAQAIHFSYSDQISFTEDNKTNFDCESIISVDTFLYLFSKNKGDNQTRVYQLSKTPGIYTISPTETFDVKGKICGAAFNPEINEVALIGYISSQTNAFIWLLNNFQGTSFFSGDKTKIEIGNSFMRWKTEGITYKHKGRLFISCESSENNKASLYVFPLNRSKSKN